MIQFDCPKCLQQINVRDQQAGQRTDCPSCAVSLLVPAPAAGLFDDLFDSDEQIVGLDGVIEDEPAPATPAAPITPAISAPSNRKQDNQPDESIDNQAKEKAQQAAAEIELFDEDVDEGDSSDIFEDLQFPDTSEVNEPLKEPLGKDPFEIDEDDEIDKRLEIDGVTDVSSMPQSFAVKCEVCDSHMFVVTQSVGTEIQCTDCFSKITVPSPTEKQIEVAKTQKSKIREAIEFDAADTASRDDEILNVEVDPSFGLAPVAQDLLSPRRNSAGEDEHDVALDVEALDDELKLEAPTDLFGGINDDFEAEIYQKSNAKEAVAREAKAKGKVREETKGRVKRNVKRNVKENAEGKLKGASREKLDPYRPRSAQMAKQKKLREKKKAAPTSSSGLDFPKFEFDSLFSEMVELVSQTNVVVRCILVGLLLATGNVIGHFAVSNYIVIKDPTLGDKAFMWFWRAGVGWVLFGLGSLLLWYFAGVVFRKTAAGNRRIGNWKIGRSTEWTSTFLLIGFSFAVAGSPMLMFGATWLSAPLRFFFALPMLVSVWYTQSPFHIISVDAFSRYRQQRPQWRSVWLTVLALASIAFVSGLLMAIAIPYLNIITSMLGAITLSFATLGYAAIAGWHSGKVIEDLK